MNSHKKRRVGVCALLLTVVATFAVMTRAQNALWSDELAFLKDQVHKSPNKVRPYCALASAQNFYGHYAEAKSTLQTLKRFAEIPKACQIAFGIAAYHLKEWPLAKHWLDQALIHNPYDLKALELRGSIALQEQDFDLAKHHFKQVVTYRPNRVDLIERYQKARQNNSNLYTD